MKAQCSRCQNFTGRNQLKDHARVGLYRCTKAPIWEFRCATTPRDCKAFRPVEPKDLPARLAFENQEGSS